MHITIIQGAFLPVPPIQGGAVEKIWYRLGKEFATMGHEVVHISRSHSNLLNEERLAGVLYKRILGYNTPSSILRLKSLDFLYSLRAIKLIFKDTDIIITNTFWAPILLRGKLGKKVYVDVQRVPKGQMKFYTHVGALRGCSPMIYEAIKAEIPSYQQHLVSYVPNPVPFEIETGGNNVEKLNIILFVGRLHPEKGVHVLIESFTKITSRQNTDWKLIIVGPHEYKDGGGGDSYLEKLKSLAMGSNTSFIGSVFDNEILTSYYRSASIFCYPAQEGSGDAAPVAPREAMAYGCVPVVSKLDCFSDIIEHKKNGLTYDHKSQYQSDTLAETLTTLMNDLTYSNRLAEEAIKVNKTFSATVIATKFIYDFRRMINAE